MTVADVIGDCDELADLVIERYLRPTDAAAHRSG